MYTKETIEAACIKSFPYPTANEGQMETIIQAVTYLLAGEQHVIIEAPTGIGKSAIAYTIHKALGAVKGEIQRSTILTHTKNLQDQYQRDFKTISILKGKTNYPCHHGAGPYTSPNCVKKCNTKECTPMVECPYVKRREKWMKDDDFANTNYDYAIRSPLQTMIESFGGPNNLMVFDECHTLPAKIIDIYTFDLNRNDYSALVGTKQFNQLFESIIGLLNLINDEHPVSMKPVRLSQNIVEFAENISSYVAQLVSSIEKNHPQYEIISNIATYLYFIRLVGVDHEVVVMKCEPGHVEIRVLYAYVVAKEAILCKATQFIHMSATIVGFKQYAELLGLSSYKTIEVANPIPVESRKVIAVNKYAISSKFTDWENYYRIIEALSKKHHNTNGIVHSPSFALLKQIKESVSTGLSDRMMISNNRDDILAELESKNNAIIMGASLSTGYDFKDDLARWQIISKVPYPYMGDPWIKVMLDRHPKLYAREAILTLIQSAGRVCRGVNDYGVTYVIDANFVSLLKNHIDLFPDWFLESIEII
jgi:Rad3-related DNA helicase